MTANDASALENFKFLKASEYFSDLAKQRPQESENAELARMFKNCARGAADALERLSTWRRQSLTSTKIAARAEAAEIYATTKMDEFIDKDPSRWERLKAAPSNTRLAFQTYLYHRR